MGIVAGCLRGIYHRCSPLFHERSRVIPLEGLKSVHNGIRDVHPAPRGSCLSLQPTTFDVEYFWSLVNRHSAGIKRRSSGTSECTPQATAQLHVATAYCYVVSSSANDCETEKRIISTKVIPKIQKWAGENFQIQIIHMDMKQDLRSRENLRLLLELSLAELNRISQYHIPPFIIVLLSETLGWIPAQEEYAGMPTFCPPGTSLLELEIVHGAYLSQNPNSFFMLRKPSFLHDLPKKVLPLFLEPEAKSRLTLLKNKIRQRFLGQTFTYQCSVVSHKLDQIADYEIEIEHNFHTRLQEFIIHRLQSYCSHRVSPSFMELQVFHQENELIKNSSHEILDKEKTVNKIQVYINNVSTEFSPPLLVIGESGSGKSAIMAKIVKLYDKHPLKTSHERDACELKSKHMSSATTYMHTKKLNTRRNSLANHDESSDMQWGVFYHFVTGASRSNELRCMLQRLWNITSLSQPRVEEIKLEVNTLAKQILDILSKTTRKKTLILIDSVDKLIDEHSFHILKWLPARLPHTIKIVLSCSPNAGIRKVLSGRDPKCLEVLVGSLSMSVSRNLANIYLQDAGIKSSEELLDSLVGKLSISNPLYIQEAVLYLRKCLKSLGIESTEEHILALARSLPDSLQALHQRHIIELESSEQGRYIIASLCLIHCSHRGLREHELLELLSKLTSSGYRSGSESGSAKLVSSTLSTPVHRKSLPNPTPLLHFDGKAGSKGFLRVSPSLKRAVTHSTLALCHSSQMSATQASMGSGEILHITTPHPIPASPTHSLAGDCFKLSPQVLPRSMRQSTSFSSASELRRSLLLIPGTVTLDGTYLYPPSKGSPSVSLHSIDLPQSPAKKLSTQSSPHPPLDCEIIELDAVPSKPLLEMDQVANLIDRHNIEPCSLSWIPISSFAFASILHKLLHFLRPSDSAGEGGWVIRDTAIRKAIHKRYFQDPPTQSFPFSFCTSETFYGADQDRTLYTLISHAYSYDGVGQSRTSSPVIEIKDLDDVAGTTEINVSKRYSWWHARLAGYFSNSSTEQRQADELPYHLSRIADHGRLAHSLVRVPLFEQLSMDKNVMDLIKYWKCVSGYDSAVKLYQQMLDDVEVSGAYSPQDIVRLMQSVAWFLYHYGEIASAKKILVAAIAYEEEKLSARSESMASLHHSLFLILSHESSMEPQHRSSTGSQSVHWILEAEHRLIQVASKCIGIYRHSPTPPSEMPSTLLTLSRHLYHFYELGGSPVLSARSALEQAREAAQEALELYSDKYDTGHTIQAYLQLSDMHLDQPSKVVQLLKDARELCRNAYGTCNGVTIDIMERLADVYCNVLEDPVSAHQYHRDIFELTKELYGIDHVLTQRAKQATESPPTNVSKSNWTREVAEVGALTKTAILIEAEII